MFFRSILFLYNFYSLRSKRFGLFFWRTLLNVRRFCWWSNMKPIITHRKVGGVKTLHAIYLLIYVYTLPWMRSYKGAKNYLTTSSVAVKSTISFNGHLFYNIFEIFKIQTFWLEWNPWETLYLSIHKIPPHH